MAAPPDLLATWTRGWAATRGVGAPVWDGDAWRIEVGQPDQLRRHVFADAGEAVRRRARAVEQPHVLLKVCAEESEVRPLLPSAWSIRPPGFMMRLDQLMPVDDAPAGNVRTAFRGGGGVLFCTLTIGDEEAARGRAVVVDGVAIYDHIVVEPAHRRRGLGRRVMLALQAATGTTQGLLVATRDGRALYETLGWRLVSSYTTAVIEA